MKARVILTALWLCIAALPASTQQPSGCEPAGNVRFICGVPSPEDLVPVPRSNWVVASGYVGGGIHLVNTTNFSTIQVFPTASPRERLEQAAYGACPGPVDTAAAKGKLSSHGLAIAAGPDRVHTVYVVHHGYRESIEAFEVDTRPNPPTFTWIGCIVAPESVAVNSVTPLPEGGVAATNPNRRTKPANPDPTNTGEVWQWNTK